MPTALYAHSISAMDMRARILGIQSKLPALTTGVVLSNSAGRTIGQISKADRLGLGVC